MTAPYKQDSLDKIYNLLFCDQLALYKADNKSSVYPWNVVLSDPPDPEKLRKVSQDTDVESQIRLLAYHRLRNMDQPVDAKELLGVIIENGLDTLAAYQDGTARYINQSGKLIVSDVRTDKSDKIISDIFKESQNVINRIGPYEGARPPAPGVGGCRLSFLVSGQLYFGQVPFEALRANPMTKPVVDATFELLQYLITLSSTTL